MKTNKVTKILVGMALAASLGSGIALAHDGDRDDHDGDRRNEQSLNDPIIGAYTTFNNIPSLATNFGVIEFQPGGLVTVHDTLDIGANPATPQGVLVSTGVGKWERISKNYYHMVYMKVVVRRGATTPFPATPFYRVKNEGYLTLSADGKTITSSSPSFANGLETTRWDLKDATLNSIPFNCPGNPICQPTDVVAQGPGTTPRIFNATKIDF